MKTVRFQFVPIWLHHSVQLITLLLLALNEAGSGKKNRFLIRILTFQSLDPDPWYFRFLFFKIYIFIIHNCKLEIGDEINRDEIFFNLKKKMVLSTRIRIKSWIRILSWIRIRMKTLLSASLKGKRFKKKTLLLITVNFIHLYFNLDSTYDLVEILVEMFRRNHWWNRSSCWLAVAL